MPALVILLAAIALAAAVFVFQHTVPRGPEFWYGHPWLDLFEASIMVLTSAVLFVTFAIFVIRRVSNTIWFFSLAACSFPVLAVLLPVAKNLHVAKHSEDWLDAGGDVPFQIAGAERILVLSLVFSAILAGMVTYGYFARKKT